MTSKLDRHLSSCQVYLLGKETPPTEGCTRVFWGWWTVTILNKFTIFKRLKHWKFIPYWQYFIKLLDIQAAYLTLRGGSFYDRNG